MATMTEPQAVTNSDDVIDMRDVTDRVEHLECELAEAHTGAEQDDVLDMRAELVTLTELLSELEGNGGDHDWRGAWYPGSMVRDDYFTGYAQQLAEDIGAVNSDATWPNNCIDWDAAAEQLKMDYSTIKFDGVTYWYR